jgi:hypothetical protein
MPERVFCCNGHSTAVLDSKQWRYEKSRRTAWRSAAASAPRQTLSNKLYLARKAVSRNHPCTIPHVGRSGDVKMAFECGHCKPNCALKCGPVCAISQHNTHLLPLPLNTDSIGSVTERASSARCLSPSSGICVSPVLHTSPTPVRRATCSSGSAGPRPRPARRPTGRDARSPAASGQRRRAWTRRGRSPRPDARPA